MHQHIRKAWDGTSEGLGFDRCPAHLAAHINCAQMDPTGIVLLFISVKQTEKVMLQMMFIMFHFHAIKNKIVVNQLTHHPVHI